MLQKEIYNNIFNKKANISIVEEYDDDPIDDNGELTQKAIKILQDNGFYIKGDKLLISPYKFALKDKKDSKGNIETYLGNKKLSEGEVRLFTNQQYGIDIKTGEVYQSWGLRGTDIMKDILTDKIYDIFEKAYKRKYN